MNAATNPSRVRPLSILQGAAYGISQPSVLAAVSLPDSRDVAWSTVDFGLSRIVGESVAGIDTHSWPFPIALAQRALATARLVQQRAGLPVFNVGRVLGSRRPTAGQLSVLLLIPYAPRCPHEALAALDWSIRALCRLIDSVGDKPAMDSSRDEFTNLVKRLQTAWPVSSNLWRFLRAAHEAQIPWEWLAGTWFQFGWGRNQCALFNSILDTTTSMGVQLARDKVACAHALRRAGLAAPVHELASDLDTAKAIAQRLGYPVVIKPPALDGGVGVAAGLESPAALERAWSETARHGEKVLVEKHQPGEDYRLIVFEGSVVWAVGRQPAGITGDGKLSVSALVSQSNKDPRRGFHASASLRPLILDDEASDLLAGQGMNQDSIPKAGHFVRLRRAANISSGGTPLVVTDRVHVENRELVERAVDLLRLDLAGVDLIIPDISVSWRETGAAIIEINAQPQLVAASQSHLYGQILASRVPYGGRIPVAVILGESGAHAMALAVLRNLRSGTAKVGLASSRGMWLAGREIGRLGLAPFAAGRAMLAQRDVDALLLVIDDASIIKSGLPVDRVGQLVLPDADSSGWLQQAIALTAPHCTAGVLGASDSVLSVCRGHAPQLPSDALRVADRSEFVGELTDWFEQQLALAVK